MSVAVPSSPIIDLTRNLGAVARLGTSAEAVDELLAEALEALGGMIPFDLATVMELSDEDELVVRVAIGPLSGADVRAHRLRLADYPSIRRLLDEGTARAFIDEDHAHGDGDPFDGVLDLPHGHSCMVVPLRAEGAPVGIITMDRQVCGAYPEAVVHLADIFGRLLALVICYGEQSMRLTRLRDQLEEQNRLLRERVGGQHDACELIDAARSPAMRHIAHLARQVAPTDAPVLLTGETGVGKEVLAHAIHGWSHREAKPMVSINCASLPAGIIESELFGHVRGAFTGASGTRIGRFQAANGGTLLLDEVGELPLDLQAKLLRVLQDGCFEPVGSDRTVRVDVRVIAATNVDLEAACARRAFREDLYYRLAVFPIRVPPLRARMDDLPVLARTALDAITRRTGRGPWLLTEENLRHLASQQWRGNVRELVNALERATILSPDGRSLGFHDADAPGLPADPTPDERRPTPTLEEVERRHIARTLQATSGKLYGPGGAAELLGLPGSTLQSRMKKLGLGTARDWR
ncbi:MAG: sigma 54-interacting transcriptional regulator [Deltaproteobacteria bacterium]|nr:sigma 54-interacting transcriptional regulator [Deltaproteobacteria bacterium]MCB9786187.1 sigma 54-interacting transcriptional regulator [Deltaproteobacteria bacterium]